MRTITVCGSTAQAPGLEGHRLTRWPFFKVPLTGWLNVLKPDGSLWLRAGPGDVLYFPAGTYANVFYPQSHRHFRATVMSEATFLAWNEITRSAGQSIPTLEHLQGYMLMRPPSRLARELITRMTAWSGRQAQRDLWKLLCREWMAELTVIETATPLSSSSRYLEIRRYLEEHSHQLLTRDSVAATFGLSPGFVSRLFRQHSPTGFHQTLMQLRLGHARTLLTSSHQPVTDVAARCGFSSANYFAQAFRRAEGISPQLWRQYAAHSLNSKHGK